MPQVYHQIVEANGKTIKENNMEIRHKIPIGTLVEIRDSDNYQGLRLYVADHQRDCDGEPLYGLGYRGLAERLETVRSSTEEDACILRHFLEAQLYSGLGEEQLKVIPDKSCETLAQLMEEYLETLNDVEASEHLGTSREIARIQIEGFIHWLHIK